MDKPAAPVFSSEPVWRSKDWVCLSFAVAMPALAVMESVSVPDPDRGVHAFAAPLVS
jgi:hypothetical protein